MKAKKIIRHNVAAAVIVLSFVFSIPVISGGPPSAHDYGRPSAEMRPVFIQLVGQAKESRASLKYDASEYGMNNMEPTAFAMVSSSLEKSAREIEKTLVYQAPTSAETRATEEEAGIVLSQLQDMASQLESTLAYSAPELTIQPVLFKYL